MLRPASKQFVVLLVLIPLFFPGAAWGRKKSSEAKEIGIELLERLGPLLAFLGTARTLEIYDRKKKFGSVLPILKLEGLYHREVTDIDGFHLSAELGMAFLGADFEYSKFYEAAPENRYDIVTAHLLYRLALIPQAQLNFAVGYKKFMNAIRNESLDIGIPLYLFPGKHLSVEARPFFSFINDESDVIYDLQGYLRFKYTVLAVKVGYRYIRIAGSELHGPEAGLVIEW